MDRIKWINRTGIPLNWSLIARLLAIFVALLLFIGCPDEKERDRIVTVSLSPDDKNLLFDRRIDDGLQLINSYNLETNELIAYQPRPNETWGFAKYSDDGKNIVFCIFTKKGKYFDLKNTQLGIMEPDGKNFRKITDSIGLKTYPSFSHSGKKVIFCKAGKIRESGKTPAADYDIYDVDIITGKETRLTWFKFFSISNPTYFPDDETIIFHATSTPGMFPDIAENDGKAIWKRKKKLDAKGLQYFHHTGENIYIVKKGARILPKPFLFNESDNIDPFIDYQAGASDPLLSRDGEQIYFRASTDRAGRKFAEGSQYYQYSKDRKHRRVTNINPNVTPSNHITSATLSPDGKSLVIVKYDESTKSRLIGILNIKEGTMRRISLPDQPSRIINP